jgi:hypothetical protein
MNMDNMDSLMSRCDNIMMCRHTKWKLEDTPICCRQVWRVLVFTGQRTGSWSSGLTRETTRSAHKVGFIREKGKAAPREGQGAPKIGSLLSTNFFFPFGPFCWGGKSLLFISLVAFWGIPRGCDLWSHLSLYRIWSSQCSHGGWENWLILSSDPPDSTHPNWEHPSTPKGVTNA